MKAPDLKINASDIGMKRGFGAEIRELWQGYFGSAFANVRDEAPSQPISFKSCAGERSTLDAKPYEP